MSFESQQPLQPYPQDGHKSVFREADLSSVREVYGRRLAVFPPYFIGALFFFATAASKDLSSILTTRFFTGFFASAPVSNTGGVLGDIYSPAAALAGSAMAVAGGPLLAPVVAGAMLVSDVTWRWTGCVRICKTLQYSVPMIALSEKQHGIFAVCIKRKMSRGLCGNTPR